MHIANEIQQFSDAVLKDEDRLAWKNTLEKLTTQSMSSSINRILEEKVLTLITIGNGRIKEDLLLLPK